MDIRTVEEGSNYVKRALVQEDGSRVSWLTIIDLPMRVGSAEVRMAGIAGVGTQREHRMKGYARRVLEDTVRYMAEEGYDVSTLFGIPNFYPKFGYATCMARYEGKVKTRDAEAAGDRARSLTTRPIGADDLPAVLALYNANNRARTGSIVRDPAQFTKFPKGTTYGTPPETQLWEDKGGALQAYAVWDRYDKAVKIVEVEAADPALFPTLLYAFAKQAVAKRCEDVQLFLPPDHAFAQFAQRYGIEWAVACPRYADGMGRICNQQPLFSKLAPELARRLAASPLAGHTGRVTLATDLGTTRLAFQDGALTVTAGTEAPPSAPSLALSQDKLMQLLMGYRTVRDVANDPEVDVTDESVPLLSVLFPQHTAYMWLADHF